MKYDATDISVSCFIANFLNGFETIYPAGEQTEITETGDGPMKKFIGDFALRASDCRDHRIRKRLKKFNSIVFTVTCSYSLKTDGTFTLWPDSFELKEFDVVGHQPALKKLLRYLGKPSVYGYRMLARRITTGEPLAYPQ